MWEIPVPVRYRNGFNKTRYVDVSEPTMEPTSVLYETEDSNVFSYVLIILARSLSKFSRTVTRMRTSGSSRKLGRVGW